MSYKLCKDCGCPVLKKGQKRKHLDDYRHAMGCRYARGNYYRNVIEATEDTEAIQTDARADLLDQLAAAQAKIAAYEKQWSEMDHTIGKLMQQNAELKGEK